jgi:hypothetical protein
MVRRPFRVRSDWSSQLKCWRENLLSAVIENHASVAGPQRAGNS